MTVTIVNRSSMRVTRVFLKKWVSEIVRLSRSNKDLKKYSNRLAKSELVIAFINADEMKKMNKQFRGKNYATDVLSFESDEPGVLGELVICPQVIVKQAAEHGLKNRHELGYMVLHGILHLLGFDHEQSKREAERMFAIQDGLFAKLLEKN
ncbi:MAG TPA: rRNA maturation RNase YbeY [Bdellovibrionales bacterium]|nr:rRNA maturation RNase YbeY [Bdellovibrionales bacterium]